VCVLNDPVYLFQHSGKKLKLCTRSLRKKKLKKAVRQQPATEVVSETQAVVETLYTRSLVDVIWQVNNIWITIIVIVFLLYSNIHQICMYRMVLKRKGLSVLNCIQFIILMITSFSLGTS